MVTPSLVAHSCSGLLSFTIEMQNNHNETHPEQQIQELGKKIASAEIAEQSFALKAPKGTRDRNPVQMRILEQVFGVIQDCFKRHDAVSIETPVFELKEVLTGKYGEESKLIYNLEDQGGELLSLRYDLTVPFARYVAMNKIMSIKRYQIGKVYRRDQPAVNRGRFREFYQCDFDIAGNYGLMMADAECLRIVYEVLRDLNLGDFVIKVNHRRFLDGIFSVIGVPPEKFNTTCSSVDKLDKATWENVEQELLQKGLSPETVDLIGHYTRVTGEAEVLDKLEADPRLANSTVIQETLREMRTLLDYCQAMGIMSTLKLDLSLARGLDYYTGVIYEAVLTGFTYDDKWQSEAAATLIPERPPNSKKKSKKKSKQMATEAEDDSDATEGAVGSVAGGGRYDNLVALFTPNSPKVPCVGVSFGVERLLAISEMLARRRAATGDTNASTTMRATETEVMVIVAHKGLIAPRLQLAQELWDAKIKTAFSHKDQPRLLDQLQYCESTGIPLAVLIGEAELQRGVVKLRCISTRKEREVARADLPAAIRSELEALRGEARQ
ncbi:Histidyl-tRNA synthetase, cytoplasmic [Echinococcus granulosus]|uniref:histidine--tRNA ligase n=1 Tax=Echinococcus granulosus TaxID=6210 RepID=U6J6L6_ECHGR|nr:Histidyl-tRNA synthetase, cytoplasmic [Echinococcus granulosus]EUB64294.1 Histidyl-tRNA synthetase, cytoplasmic [Echinococcus granulosus]CDS17334.1 histidyl tRNA synthetase [Echinococcus granulosus]